MYYSVVSRSVVKQATAAAAQASRMAAVSTQTRLYSSTLHDNDPQVLEQEKARNLRKGQHKRSSPFKDAPGWDESVASASEANVKADRSDFSPSDLAAQTVEYVRKRLQEEEEDLKEALAESIGKHPEDVHEERADAQEASYERDEISGPLREKGVKEKVEAKKETVKKPA